MSFKSESVARRGDLQEGRHSHLYKPHNKTPLNSTSKANREKTEQNPIKTTLQNKRDKFIGKSQIRTHYLSKIPQKSEQPKRVHKYHTGKMGRCMSSK